MLRDLENGARMSEGPWAISGALGGDDGSALYGKFGLSCDSCPDTLLT